MSKFRGACWKPRNSGRRNHSSLASLPVTIIVTPAVSQAVVVDEVRGHRQHPAEVLPSSTTLPHFLAPSGRKGAGRWRQQSSFPAWGSGLPASVSCSASAGLSRPGPLSVTHSHAGGVVRAAALYLTVVKCPALSARASAGDPPCRRMSMASLGSLQSRRPRREVASETEALFK